jgi:hypothetical protein
MYRRTFLTSIAAVACTKRSAVAPRPATPHFAYVDAVAPFLAWASAAHPSDDYAVRAFREGVVAPHPELYERSVIGGREGETLDQRILRLLPRLRANAGAIANIHRRFASDSDAAVGRFRAALPDFSWRGPTYLFVSLGAMNGGTRQVAGKQALLFGVDVIADTEAIGVHPIEVLFAHELFHAHQLGVLGPDDAETRVYEALWLEGLATYASMKLVPGTAETAALPSTHAFGEKKERARARRAPARPRRFDVTGGLCGFLSRHRRSADRRTRGAQRLLVRSSGRAPARRVALARGPRAHPSADDPQRHRHGARRGDRIELKRGVGMGCRVDCARGTA